MKYITGRLDTPFPSVKEDFKNLSTLRDYQTLIHVRLIKVRTEKPGLQSNRYQQINSYTNITSAQDALVYE